MHYKDDYLFGKNQEKRIKPILDKHFKVELTHSSEQYSKYDFECDEFYIEIKSRKCSYNSFPTTLLTCNKITNVSKDLIFVFNFNDGIYYIKYDQDRFNNYLKKSFSRSGFSFDYKDYYYIPINDLLKIQD